MRAILSLLGLAFAGMIVWAMGEKPIGESSDFFFNDPWGIVALADLYLGFLLFILFMFYTAKSKLIALVWSLLLVVLGNVVSVAYVVCFLSGIGVKKRPLNEN